MNSEYHEFNFCDEHDKINVLDECDDFDFHDEFFFSSS